MCYAILMGTCQSKHANTPYCLLCYNYIINTPYILCRCNCNYHIQCFTAHVKDFYTCPACNSNITKADKNASNAINLQRNTLSI